LAIHLTNVTVAGFRRFKEFSTDLSPSFNIIVGNNESGKSSLLEAIGLALTGRIHGRLIKYAIDPYLFNRENVTTFFERLRDGKDAAPPKIVIEAYLDSDEEVPELEKLRGSNNTRSEDCPGLVLTVKVESHHTESLKEYAADKSNPDVIPVEFYHAPWRSFSGNGVAKRRLPFRTANIDATLPRFSRGASRYVSEVVEDVLSDEQRRDLALEYRKLRHTFSQEPGVKAINEHLKTKGNPATTKDLSVQMDLSSKTSWDSSITAHLDELPFDCAGQGEQCRVQLRLAIVGAEDSGIILIEEPENHLSHSNLNVLLEDIRNDCEDRQVVVTTHSGYVLNKLGLDSLKLLSHSGSVMGLDGLTKGTRDYFVKLPGYDTLRLLLAKRAILVEGPSDELIVQSAYKKATGRLPLDDGIDVITVGSLAFKRFLEIAALLTLDVRVVTDNDGDVAALERKYAEYLGDDSPPSVSIHFDSDEAAPSLEPQLLKANSREVLNAILGTELGDDHALLTYMRKNKTDCALKIFETEHDWTVPHYIQTSFE